MMVIKKKTCTYLFQKGLSSCQESSVGQPMHYQSSKVRKQHQMDASNSIFHRIHSFSYDSLWRKASKTGLTFACPRGVKPSTSREWEPQSNQQVTCWGCWRASEFLSFGTWKPMCSLGVGSQDAQRDQGHTLCWKEFLTIQCNKGLTINQNEFLGSWGPRNTIMGFPKGNNKQC